MLQPKFRKLPHGLSVELIKKMDHAQRSATAIQTAAKIPIDEWFTKVSIVNTLWEASEDLWESREGTDQIRLFITAFEEAWQQRLPKRA
ncbi:MAG: hypothetical protein KGH53_02260 [Candidatus Micrarchaeota archaeon]|nr:hypothetical protein [Candidatus Micrarchaeota archaeon]